MDIISGRRPLTLGEEGATNLATERDNLTTYLATETLRRGDVCGGGLATDVETDVATETLRHPTMCQGSIMYQGYVS